MPPIHVIAPTMIEMEHDDTKIGDFVQVTSEIRDGLQIVYEVLDLKTEITEGLGAVYTSLLVRPFGDYATVVLSKAEGKRWIGNFRLVPANAMLVLAIAARHHE